MGRAAAKLDHDDKEGWANTIWKPEQHPREGAARAACSSGAATSYYVAGCICRLPETASRLGTDELVRTYETALELVLKRDLT